MMEWLNILGARLRALFRRESVLQDIEEELRAHVEMETETNIERGMPPDEARAAAQKSFGNLGRHTELGYDIRGGGWLETLWQDLRYGARMLLRSPSFTTIATLTLAVGIGANAALFSVVNAVLLRPLPHRDSERLTILWNSFPGRNQLREWVTRGEYQAINTQNHVFEQIALLYGSNVNLTGPGDPERIGGAQVSASLFSILDVRPSLGRLLTPEEDRAGQAPVAVLSYSFWQRRFGSDQSIIGKSQVFDGQSYTVVGILPAHFKLMSPDVIPLSSYTEPDVLLPLSLTDEELHDHGRRGFNILARLRPGVTAAQAQAEMNILAANLQRDFSPNYPPNSGFQIRVVPLLEQAVGGVRRALLLLLGASGLVLLIACANVANLALSRAIDRRKEIAIRTAIGAGRLRVVRQLLTENLLLASLGGSLGLLLAWGGLEVLRLFGPSDIPRLEEIGLDGRVTAFTFITTLLTAGFFSLAPALRTSQVNLNDALKDAGKSSSGSGQRQLHRLMIISEIALALVLLAGAGLLIRSFARLLKVQPGFNAHQVFTARLALPKYSEQMRAAFYSQLEERVGRLPGIEAAGLITGVPFSGVISRIDILST